MVETILTRAMNDAEFAEQLLVDTDQALAGYNLSADEIAKFKGMSRADFAVLASASPEERKSFVRCIGCTWDPPMTNHNQTALRVRH